MKLEGRLFLVVKLRVGKWGVTAKDPERKPIGSQVSRILKHYRKSFDTATKSDCEDVECLVIFYIFFSFAGGQEKFF